ncbi:hypothetical protein GKZ68_13870 [Hymenobacter sp. BRD128]|uniref:hypothetical protein n=1 Tax=Hymenobacter sp. BRD128 TaxID=2675878 RepID=UPI0015673589|nr:hypothetical protein [Hymenobacter sp. BRD128]QKG57615.1 hypothetical protein GKZ68_13870 [Hymenobacter sp. BRD128]
MKNLFCTLLLTLCIVGAYAQKIAVKKNLMTVDGQPYARIEGDGGALTSTQYYINSPQNERLFVVKLLSFNDPGNASPNNPTGSTAYLQFVFTASRIIVETPMPGLFRSLSVARQIYGAQLLKNGALDKQAVADFSVNNGTVYSERRRALDQAAYMPPLGY